MKQITPKQNYKPIVLPEMNSANDQVLSFRMYVFTHDKRLKSMHSELTGKDRRCILLDEWQALSPTEKRALVDLAHNEFGLPLGFCKQNKTTARKPPRLLKNILAEIRWPNLHSICDTVLAQLTEIANATPSSKHDAEHRRNAQWMRDIWLWMYRDAPKPLLHECGECDVCIGTLPEK